jgi:hypothetical protein
VVIFGGPRKDIQLFEDGGAAVADTVAAIDQSVVIDLDALSKGKQLRFLAAFFERLYDVNRRPLLLIADEADRYASQKPMSPEATVALGAAEDIARRARKRGIGSMWLTQRTAVLNKNVSDLCDLTAVFRTPGARDLDELEDRVGRLASKEQVREVMKAAPGLEDGQVIFLSTHPKLRGYLPATIRPVQLPLPRTYDSSATPGLKVRVAEPKVLAQTDLAEIEARMAQQIAQAKADDPRELRKQIQTLKAELAKKQPAVANKQPAVSQPKIIEKPVITDAQIATLEASVSRLGQVADRTFGRIEQSIDQAGNRLHAPIVRLKGELQALVSAARTAAPRDTPVATTASSSGSVGRTSGRTVRPAPSGDRPTMPKMHRAMLTVLAHAVDGPNGKPLTKKQIRVRTGYRDSGPVSSTFADLMREGWAVSNGTGLRVTPEGLAALGSYEELPTGALLRAELVNGTIGKLSQMERKFLKELFLVYPADMTKAELREACSYADSGPVSSAFGHLVALDYAVAVGTGRLKASGELFEEA